MAPLPSPLPHRAPKPSVIDTFSNDHALLPGHDWRSEAALSSDFQLFPDEAVSTSPYMTTPSSLAVPSVEKKSPQGTTKTHEHPREARDQTMLPAYHPSERMHYLMSLNPLPSTLNHFAPASNSRCSAGYIAPSTSTAELLPGSPRFGVANASGPEDPDQSLYLSWTQAAAKSSDKGNDVEDYCSPPPAPRVKRLQTPDLVPMEARAFCDCCTTSGARRACEICQKKKAERDFDLLGVGMMFY